MAVRARVAAPAAQHEARRLTNEDRSQTFPWRSPRSPSTRSWYCTLPEPVRPGRRRGLRLLQPRRGHLLLPRPPASATPGIPRDDQIRTVFFPFKTPGLPRVEHQAVLATGVRQAKLKRFVFGLEQHQRFFEGRAIEGYCP